MNSTTLAQGLASGLPDRVRQSRDVDPMSLVEEYIGRANSRQFFMQLLRTGAPLVICDVAAFIICFWAGLGVAAIFGCPFPVAYGYIFCVLMVAILGTFFLMGLYNGGGMHPIYEFRQTMVSSTIVFVLVAAMMASTSSGFATMVSFPLILITVPTFRAILRAKLLPCQWWGVRCIVFDSNKRINNHFAQHQKNTTRGLRPVGFIQAEVPDYLKPEYEDHYLGTVDKVRDAISMHRAHCALVHRCGRPDHEIFNYVSKYMRPFSRIIIVPDDDRLPSLWSLGRTGGICLEDKLLRPCSQIMKRTMDVLFSFVGLIVLTPALLAIAIWTKWTAPGPLFFGHERIGKHGRRFKAWKFRTMVVNSDEVLEKTLAENPAMREEWQATYKLQNDPRITPPGRLLRKTSLDELPQLWNVLKGEMSLVGPRPIVVGEVDRYHETLEQYLRVTPGITGFWQISGRNLTTYDRRVELDDYYVKNWSIWFDLYILVRTVKTVLFREGAF